MALTQINADEKGCISTACPNCSGTYVLHKAVVNDDNNRVEGYICKGCFAQFTGTP